MATAVGATEGATWRSATGSGGVGAVTGLAGVDWAAFFSSASLANLSFSAAALLAAACAMASFDAAAADAEPTGAEAAEAAATSADDAAADGADAAEAGMAAAVATSSAADAARSGAEAAATGALAAAAIANWGSGAGPPDRNLKPSAAQATAATPAMAQIPRLDVLAAGLGLSDADAAAGVTGVLSVFSDLPGLSALSAAAASAGKAAASSRAFQAVSTFSKAALVAAGAAVAETELAGVAVSAARRGNITVLSGSIPAEDISCVRVPKPISEPSPDGDASFLKRRRARSA